MNQFRKIWLGRKRITRARSFRTASFIFGFIFSFYILFLNYTEPTEIGIARNWISGKMWIQEGGGWHLTAPWTWVARVDLRPMRVSVQSAGRGFSGKLVQFDPAEWKEFVQVEGWRYYWWANRLSFNFGYDEEHRGMKDILRGHAFGAKKYSFIRVIQEYGPDE